jgi:hypothetical protein
MELEYALDLFKFKEIKNYLINIRNEIDIKIEKQEKINLEIIKLIIIKFIYN